jgi:hypothetical protein
VPGRTIGLTDSRIASRSFADCSQRFLLKYADYVEGSGIVLYDRICELDLEGIVAKLKCGPYVSDRESSTWFKVLNPNYSQRVGREELFERDRRKEPVPGWHSCVVACAELEEAS